ncbi:MAG: lytic transglycosylase domain-containing protein [Thermodesulfobacteriota bacterium]|nr:lytic transglycosylase domain-containing protein [Thermodesulfobacteriota bacterium]
MDEESPTNRYSVLLTCLMVFIIGVSLMVLIPSVYIRDLSPQTAVSEAEACKIAIQEPSEEKPSDPAPEVVSQKPLVEKAKYPYNHIIKKAADRYEIDPALVKAIIMAESNYNPRAISKTGARGLMQLMPATAEALGVEDCFNPEHNIRGGVRYFRQLLNRFDGNIELALAAYNAGSRKVRKYNGIPPFKATQIYIEKVSAYYELYKKEMSGELERV